MLLCGTLKSLLGPCSFKWLCYTNRLYLPLGYVNCKSARLTRDSLAPSLALRTRWSLMSSAYSSLGMLDLSSFFNTMNLISDTQSCETPLELSKSKSIWISFLLTSHADISFYFILNMFELSFWNLRNLSSKEISP